MISSPEALAVVTQPIRRKIIEALVQNGRMNSRQIANAVGLTQQLAYYHMLQMAEAGVTTVEFETSPRHKIAWHQLRGDRIVFAVPPLVPPSQRAFINLVCPRCSGEHEQIQVTLYNKQLSDEPTGFAVCPATGEPVPVTLSSPAVSSTPSLAQR